MVFNDRPVAEWDAHDVDVVGGTSDTHIPPGESREITFVVTLDNDDVVEWFMTHVDNEEVTDAEMRAQLAMQINDETVTVPPEGDAIECEYEMTTAISSTRSRISSRRAVRSRRGRRPTTANSRTTASSSVRVRKTACSRKPTIVETTGTNTSTTM